MMQDGFLSGLADTGAPDSPTHGFVSEEGVTNARGRVLGGSTAINAGFYSRTHPWFFRATGVEWDMALVNETFQLVEREVAFRPVIRSWQSVVRDGILEAHVTPYNGFTFDHVVGTKIGASTFDSSDRCHTAADHLADAPNLWVALRATIDRILLNSFP